MHVHIWRERIRNETWYYARIILQNNITCKYPYHIILSFLAKIMYKTPSKRCFLWCRINCIRTWHIVFFMNCNSVLIDNTWRKIIQCHIEYKVQIVRAFVHVLFFNIFPLWKPLNKLETWRIHFWTKILQKNKRLKRSVSICERLYKSTPLNHNESLNTCTCKLKTLQKCRQQVLPTVRNYLEKTRITQQRSE